MSKHYCIVEVSMNQIILWICVDVEYFKAERAIISSNAVVCACILRYNISYMLLWVNGLGSQQVSVSRLVADPRFSEWDANSKDVMKT